MYLNPVRIGLALAIVASIGAASSELSAQHIAVPGAAVTGTDIEGIGELAGVSMTLRQQFLIGATHLQPLRGKVLTELWFRRDGGYTNALNGGAFDLQLTLSNTTADPAAPASEFAVNHGAAPVVVFTGRVAVPSSPALATTSPWLPENTIPITFTQPFAYTGATLCVDVVGRSVPGQASDFWPLDYMTGDAAGTVQMLGRSCSRFAAGNFTASAAPGTLVPGSTAVFEASGSAMMPGTWMLSAANYPNGIDLSTIGATACALHTAGGVMLGVTYGPGVGRLGDGPGFAAVHVRLPSDPGLMGATLYTQWSVLELLLPPQQWSNPLGVSLSNGVRATLSAVPNTLGLATITSETFANSGPVPTRGAVNCRKGPVVRFGHN